MDKSPEAFRTISEVADLLETPAHVLRFWESRFTQIKPVKRAGGRRYYRPADVALLAGIRRLLHDEGMTIRGVQKVLRENGVRHVAALASGQTFVDSDFEELLEAAETADFQPAPQGAEVIPLAAFAPELREVVADAAPKPDAPPLPETAPDIDPGPLPQPGPVEVANPALEDVLPEDMPATAETYAGQPDDVIDDLPEDLSPGPEALAPEELPVLPSEDAGLDDLAGQGDAEHAPLQPDLFADLDPQPLLTALETETVAVEAVEVADFLTDDAVPDTPAPLAEDGPTNLFAPEFAPDQNPESESDSDGLPESASEPAPLLDLAPDQSEAEAVADDVTGEVEPPSAAKAESPADSSVIWWPAAIRALPRSPLHDAGLALVAARARDLLARLQSHR